jgi:hypothetical protein
MLVCACWVWNSHQYIRGNLCYFIFTLEQINLWKPFLENQRDPNFNWLKLLIFWKTLLIKVRNCL